MSTLNTVGVLGVGNMGAALARGILRSKELKKRFPVLTFDRHIANMAALEKEGAQIATSAKELVAASKYIVLAVKPYQTETILAEIVPALTKDKVLISIVTGYKVDTLIRCTEEKCPVVRVMPNILTAAGAGQYGLCFDDTSLPAEERAAVTTLFEEQGHVTLLEESRMNAYAALAGCGPAFVYYFAEALVEAGVTMGIDRPEATEIVLGLLDGSVKLARTSGKHMSLLRETVTSPGGTTIAALNAFDGMGMRSAVVQGLLAAFDRGEELENEAG